ncbi:hypothetical protein GBA52_015280 [Prunus armeniaca]|nr:hypothetical protein GBA52_015280 [Prunus armeniaca]
MNVNWALDKIRFESMTDKSKLNGQLELFIPDKNNNTLTIIDSGIGMTKVDSLSTSSLAAIQSACCSSCVASCILEFSKAKSFKQINFSIVFGLKLAFFSDTNLPPALKHDFDAIEGE